MVASQLKICLTVITYFVTISYQYEIESNSQNMFIPKGAYVDDYYSFDTNYLNNNEKVEIKLFYETLCPGCREFDTTDFKQVVEKLGEYLNINTYPYGFAKTFINNGTITFACQHLGAECYGNKLHACALDTIKNRTEALLYNSCMMTANEDENGSDDAAADRCGQKMNVNSNEIKACAKEAKGTQLLKFYGEESSKVNYQYVPFVMINGKENNQEHFLRDVCRAFIVPPPPCQKEGL